MLTFGARFRSSRILARALSTVTLGYDPRYGSAMSCNYECLSALNVIEQLGQPGFRIGSLNLAHCCSRLVDMTRRTLPQLTLILCGDGPSEKLDFVPFYAV